MGYREVQVLISEPEQLQPVGFLPQTLRSLPQEELLGGQGTPTPCSQEGSSRGNEIILARSHPLMSSCSLGADHIWPKYTANPRMQLEQGAKFPCCFLLVNALVLTPFCSGVSAMPHGMG